MSSDARRLHPSVIVMRVLGALRSWFGLASLPLIFALFQGGFDPQRLALVLIPLVSAVFAGAYGVLSWMNTEYGIQGNAFYFRQGVVGKSERTVPLDHIQSVDIVQGVLQRLFNVVEVRVETAGGGGAEADVSLPAVSRPAAMELQQRLAPRQRPAVAAEGPGVQAPPETGEVVIRRLSLGELLVAGATSGQIGVAVPVIAAASQLFDDFLTPEFVVSFARSWLPSSVAAIAVLVAAVLVVAWLVAILGTVLSYYGFTLSREGDSLRIRRGLLERREVTIPINRIQAVQIVENVFRQPFGLALVRMESAGYGADAGVSTTLFPLLRTRHVVDFLAAAAPEFAVSPPLHPLPGRALRRYIVRTVFPLLLPLAAVAGLLVWRVRPEYALVILPALAAAAWYGLLRFRGTGWAASGEYLVVRDRDLARTTAVAPRRRLQARSVSQSPFQRRLRLATLSVRVARGSTFAVVDMDADAAVDALDILGPRRQSLAP